MRKIIYITIIVVMLLVGFLGITYSYEYNDDESLKFELIGPYELYLDVNSEYEEYGIKVFKNGTDISSYVNIDNSSVDMNTLGKYSVKYELDVDGNKEYVYRIVWVIDRVKPQIKLNGEKIVYLNLNDTYYEYGCVVTDNYDIDLSREVIITSNLDVTQVGEYRVEYSVIDSSGNENSVIRKVIVR